MYPLKSWIACVDQLAFALQRVDFAFCVDDYDSFLANSSDDLWADLRVAQYWLSFVDWAPYRRLLD
jgi:hypothetical protein